MKADKIGQEIAKLETKLNEIKSQFILEEYDPTYLAKINFTISCFNFSAAGYYNSFTKQIKTWATVPTKFQKQSIKRELEEFLSKEKFK